jgi:tRNA G18 (ribose-2'-O)-methylase SpoU
MERTFPIKKFPIVVLTDNLTGEANIGSLFRLADSFNIEKIVFTGTPVNLESNRLKRTARATIQNVENEFFEDPEDAIKKYTEAGYTALALEITSDSVAFSKINFENEQKVLLVIGNERHGISKNLLSFITLKVHVEMFGRNSSMNVSQATGIALYEITKTLPSLQEK